MTTDKNNFYIYQHLKADTGEIFYVGTINTAPTVSEEAKKLLFGQDAKTVK